MLLSVRFERTADGYQVTVSHSAEGLLSASPRTNAVAGRELTFRLGADGTLIGMVDEAAYWAALEAAGPETMRERGTPVRVRGTGVAPHSARALPDEARLALLAESVLPIFSFAGATLLSGESRLETRPADTLFGRTTASVSMSLDRVADGVAFLRRETRVPRRRMEGLVNAFYVELGGPRAARAPRIYVSAYTHQERAEVSIETGVTRHYTASRSADMVQGNELSQILVTTRIERIATP